MYEFEKQTAIVFLLTFSHLPLYDQNEHETTREGGESEAASTV